MSKLDTINVLLANRSDIMRYTSISGNVDDDVLMPFILTAGDTGAQYVLGTQLYEKLRQLIKADETGDPGNEDYKELLEVYVTPYVVFQTMVDYLPFQAYTTSRGGVDKHYSENSMTAEMQDVSYLVSRYEDKATFYKKRLIDYLCNNSALFPEYHQNKAEDLPAGSSGAGGGGFVLGRNQAPIHNSRFRR